MKRNPNQYFNPRRYEEHLSPFGRTVLNVMIKQSNTEREHNRNIPQFPTRRCPDKKRVITFSGSNVLEIPAPKICEQINSVNDLSERRPFERKTLLCEPFVLTSAELVRTEELGLNTNDNNYFSRDGLNNSTLVNSYIKSRNVVYDLHSNKSSDSKDTLNPLDINTHRNDPKHHASAIVWNDMFDTELFLETNVPSSPIFEDIHNDLSKEKHFHVQCPADNETIDKPLIVNSDKPLTRNIKEMKGENSKKVPKRKNQSKITDIVRKKVKRVATVESSKTLTRNSFRKHKYTKTVKNWLKNVDTSNIVEEHDDTLGHPVVSAVQAEVKSKVSKPEITIEKTCKVKTKNKKIVQAQLTNKNGIMKFGKPKKAKNNCKSNSQETVVGENQVTNKDNLDKDRKTKSKFVAPIKSQIPVKEVSFDINTVDNINITQYVKFLHNLENKDVTAVLVYSNGFCQLNNHHTDDDACDAEGIMFNVDNQFYYLKGNDEHYRFFLHADRIHLSLSIT